MGAPRVLVIVNAESDPPGRVAEWLTEAGLGLRVVTGARLPADLTGFDGLVVLGGGMSAWDDEIAPWLPHERALLRAAVADEVPTLAICLGAQLLAAANGGRVAPNPDGPEFGAQLIAKRAAAATDPLFGPVLPITPDVIQWHFDAVTELPPGAVLLAGSPVCEHQAYRLGRLAWGMQFHIETTPEIVRAWAATDAAHLDGYDLESMLSRSDAAHHDVAEVWAPVVRAFADVVRDPAAVAASRAVRSAVAAPVTDPAAIRAALAAEAHAARTPLPTPALRDDGDAP
jgi:GMP synthase-like glutamine amidotransferase